MFSVDVESTLGQVSVQTTQNKGLSPEYWTERILEKLVSVSEGADPMVRAQAEAFKEQIEKVILIYMKQAILSDRSTVAGMLEKQGHKEMANIIRRL
jgi:hypothetical protein|tara:strand:- start:1563 stop:1853 length:291 start_codon:yes stop_codon:yes gene_type:complete